MEPLPELPENEAFMVLTEIIEERGQWVVYLEIVFLQRVARYRIQAYPKKRLAELAAQYIKRAANRDRPFASEGR